MLVIDAVAAWKMRREGWDPEEWLDASRLRRFDNITGEKGEAIVRWRQRVGMAPGGSWFSVLEVVVDEHGAGRLDFNPVILSRDVSYGVDRTVRPDPSTTRRAWMRVARRFPDAMLAALPGRAMTDLVDHAALRGVDILDANPVTGLGFGPNTQTIVAVTQPVETMDTPWWLMH